MGISIDRPRLLVVILFLLLFLVLFLMPQRDCSTRQAKNRTSW